MFVKFDGSAYKKKKRPDGFSAETNRTVTADTNLRLGTTYDPKDSFRKGAGLSNDHKLAIDNIMQKVIDCLNSIHLSTSRDQPTIQGVFKVYKNSYMAPIFTDLKKVTDAELSLGILESTVISAYSNALGGTDTDSVCTAASSFIKELHNSPDNLRDGFARVNSAIQEKFDPHIVRLSTGEEQMTPRSKQMGKSEYRHSTGVALTPSRNHYLSSDFSTKRSLGDLTPDSRGTIDAMQNHVMKKSKW